MAGEMIRDTADEVFLRGLLSSVRAVMTDGDGEVGAGGPDPVPPGLEASSLSIDDAVAMVEETIAQALPSTMRSTGRVRARDEAQAEPYLPHAPVAALLQSALEQYVDDHRPELARASAPGARAGGRVPIFTERRLLNPGGGPQGSRLVGSFQPADVRWIASALWHGIRAWSSKHPFNDTPAQVALGERARLVVVGDWGSGLPRAQLVADQMRVHLEAAEREGVEAHAVHLGDVYYSGLPREYEHRFLAPWPVHPGEQDRFRSWCLNANHDMYSGGYGYFDHLLADDRFARQAGSSWFTIGNEKWCIVGLDTAWDEDGLHDDRSNRGLYGGQADLVNRLAADAGPRLVLLSHHPLFSGADTDEYLRAKLAPALDAGAVHAWFWGHEHVAEAYEAREGVAHPVCVGHGGVPVYAVPWSKVGRGILWRENGHILEGLQPWALFGFAVLDFAGATLKVRYFNERGALSYEEDLS